MSSEALNWALRQQTEFPLAKLALITMADQAPDRTYPALEPPPWYWTGNFYQLVEHCDARPVELRAALNHLTELALARSTGDGGYELGRYALEGDRLRIHCRCGPGVPASIRRAVMERDGHRCVRCGATENLTLDHIHPQLYGGRHTMDNLQVLCRSCNSSKGARI